jgi:hypothetical protein
MGAWGFGSFENDIAIDFLADLCDSEADDIIDIVQES